MTTTAQIPSTTQITQAWALARAYGHAWGGYEGEALVDAWREAGAVPDDWRERLHTAVEPTCGPAGGITSPSPVTVHSRGTQACALSHETTTGRLSWRIEHVTHNGALQTTFELSRPVGAVYADAIAAAPVERLPAMLDLLRRARHGSVTLARLTLVEPAGVGESSVSLDANDLDLDTPIPARADHWHALAEALVACVGSWPDARELIAAVRVEEWEGGHPRGRARRELIAACDEAMRAAATRRALDGEAQSLA
jgi:hypothetical protein